jgi:hypothetical protein
VKFLFAVVVFVIFSIPSLSQKQLVLLKGEDVLLRLYPGDEIKLKVKGKKTVMTTYINNLFDNRLVTHRDTILFSNIERLYFKRPLRINILGGAMVVGGVGLFGIDQLNHSAIQGNEADLDRGVTTASIALVGLGLPMLLAKKNSTKLSYKYRLLTVKEGSVFYRRDSRGFVSPYIQN